MPAATDQPVTAPHRLVLTAAEYAFLVAESGFDLPPEWAPAPDITTGAEAAALLDRGMLRGSGDLTTVHPSVEANLRVLAAPRIMIDTTATVGARGSRSLHAFNGALGASLFLLPEAAVELSLFAAVDLGRELVRAVPAWQAGGFGSLLDDPVTEAPLRGSVPLDALHELGIADLMREADPGAAAHVLDVLRLPEAEAAFAQEVVRRTDGVLRCLATAVVHASSDRPQVRSAQLTWLHSDTGWVGIRPAAVGTDRRLVELAPVERDEIGVWLAPYVAEALT
ncbi:hypothetical protein UO65_4144 [Actinokineospora spheciospongiae]|uniref:ESAT-6 protein secretion system EspG family protein n=1 Tax=Actinokineospora spheciospongiae TaxID=909613 RepID=W7IV21_9PSEU|nr:ESX secretion-associated protein EspG [Actinokineospora spheciospongiae]EWC60572.1 hypothetical protein UO65_4144 [Actinokineospora spheciospongiae]